MSILLAISCSLQEDGQMVLRSCAKDGYYNFDVNFQDGARYRTAIVARYDAQQMPQGLVEMDIMLTSPDGDKYIDRVDFHIGEADGKIRDIKWPYRENVVLSGGQSGLWRVSIRPVDADVAPAISAMGFTYETY